MSLPDRSASLTADPLGEYLHATLTPVSSKKRPAYKAATEARRMVIAEVVAMLRTEALKWTPGSPYWMRSADAADLIEERFGGPQ